MADAFPCQANGQGNMPRRWHPSAGAEPGVSGTQTPSRANAPAGFKSNKASFHEEC